MCSFLCVNNLTVRLIKLKIPATLAITTLCTNSHKCNSESSILKGLRFDNSFYLCICIRLLAGNSVKEQITHRRLAKAGADSGFLRGGEQTRKVRGGGWRHLLFGQMFPKIARKLRKSDWEGAWVNILLCRSATGKSNVENNNNNNNK